MWKWLAIGIGVLSMLIAFILSQSWMHGTTLHEAVGWVLTGILAAQLTALVLRKWRVSLIAPLLCFVLIVVDSQWLGPCRDGCSVTIQVPVSSR
ncbi:hypothetical protein [Sphingomonas kyeonggiensis]|uniref:Uncharacterized protein n=1 Tax=Sphingomonas kyeonggiensis TaxID=1268553 RepID=A0A7W6JWL2_9SPHN|nr:hypothetical protein [Sphingomonas kyeonggiensis]MBB4100890.1 hypothetical protein [Sphingomonas kyeonggiensis]